ncbi:MAG: hypothetical protein QOI14_1533 [Actinomycetota bacterium]|nr:hypothetical protein [Actinomycetota bacterium]
MTDLLDKLTQATALLRDVARVDHACLSDEEVTGLLVATEAAGRLADTARTQVAAEVDARSRFEFGSAGLSMRHGHRKPVHLIEMRTRVSQSEAARRIRLGIAIRLEQTMTGERMPAPHPHVARAMIDGSLGLDSATAIVQCLKQARLGSEATPQRIDAAERSLVKTARTESADLVADAARVWREQLDPDGAEPRYEETLQRRGVSIGRERNGITDIHIKAPQLGAALFKAALADSTVPGAVPRFMSEEDIARGTETVLAVDSEIIAVARDLRSREHKQYDILLGVLEAGVRVTHDGPANMRTTGAVTAIITLDNLESGAGIGWLDDSNEPLPTSVIQEMACDSGFRRVLLGNAGEPLYEGRLERYFTAAQRRALAVRDGGCVGPGCTAPPSWCHAHHVKPWSRDGETDIGNGVLLCPAHHHALHAGAFDIAMTNGKPMLRLHSYLDGPSEWMPVGGTRATLVTA